MKQRIRQLFYPAELPVTPRGAIAWWESRRLAYNAVVWSVAMVALVIFFLVVSLSGELEPGEDPVEPLALVGAAFVLPVLINFFYTFGWLVEVAVRLVTKSRLRRFGPCLFAVGLAFSLLVVSSPALLWLAHVAGLIGR